MLSLLIFTNTTLKHAVDMYSANPTISVENYGAIEDWDTSNVTNMDRLFQSKTDFNAHITDWDTSSVTSMIYMFNDAYKFNQPLHFDTSSVTSMQGMFANAVAFNQGLEFDMRNVLDTGACVDFVKNTKLSSDNAWHVCSMSKETGDANKTCYSDINASLRSEQLPRGCPSKLHATDGSLQDMAIGVVASAVAVVFVICCCFIRQYGRQYETLTENSPVVQTGVGGTRHSDALHEASVKKLQTQKKALGESASKAPR